MKTVTVTVHFEVKSKKDVARKIEALMEHGSIREAFDAADLELVSLRTDDQLAPGNQFLRDEVRSIYVDREERFVTSLVVGYANRDGVRTPKAAAKAALDLIRDDQSDGTRWFVFDRKTRTMHEFHQEDFDPEWTDVGKIL